MRFTATVALVVLASVSLGCESTQVAGMEAERRDHGIYTPEEVDWRSGPASLPRGAQMAVLEGDPAEAEFFIMRLRLPDGYTIPPHWHPTMERVTVLEGTLHLGMSENVNLADAERLPAGSYFYMPPEMVHFAQAEGETILQIGTMGPWGIVYVDPADDPRR